MGLLKETLLLMVISGVIWEERQVAAWIRFLVENWGNNQELPDLPKSVVRLS